MNANDKYHPDVKLFLILIPIISAFNYYLMYSNIRLNSFLALTYIIDTLQGYIAWFSVRWIIIYLDTKLPYAPNHSRRIFTQVVITTIIGMLIITLLTELVSWIAKGEPALPNFYTTDLFIIFIWFLVLNSIYIALHFMHETRSIKSSDNNNYLWIDLGKKKISIPVSKIRFVKLANGITEIKTSDSSVKCMITLDFVEKKVSTNDFFRLNRQYITHRNYISSYDRVENGKLHVHLLNGESTTVSRTRAPKFKPWLQSN